MKLLSALAVLCLVAAVYGDATSDLKKVAKDCQDFFNRCGAGCKSGWSANCGGGPGRWGGVTKCNCAKWGGNRPPKKEQSEQQFLQEAYNAHNTYRRKHHAGNLRVDRNAENVAKNYANRLAQYDIFEHNQNRGDLGENIYYSSGIVEGKDAVDAWYDEVNDPGYRYNPGGFGMGTGHFTQIVWKGTTGVGCGRATSRSKKTYVVCNYSPPGNMQGQFKQNVLRP